MATGVVKRLMRCTTNAAAFSTQTDCQLAASRLGNLVRNVVELEHHTDRETVQAASRRQQAATEAAAAAAAGSCPTVSE